MAVKDLVELFSAVVWIWGGIASFASVYRVVGTDSWTCFVLCEFEMAG